MGRSVSNLSNADVVIYFSDDAMSGFDAEGNFNSDEAELNWEDFYGNLKFKIKSKLKSYVKCEKWEDEVGIFLENDLCEIGISEYCGCYSLSVRAKEPEYGDDNRLNFAKYHASQIEKSLMKILSDLGCDVLKRLGTFSNGCGVYEKATI